MKKLDQWNGVAFLIISGIICWGSTRLPYGNVHNPGPGFLPFWLGVVMGLLSIALLIKTTFQTERVKMIRELFAKKIRWGKVFYVLAGLILYAFLMDYLGFLLITFLFIAFLTRFIDPQSWKKVIGWALVGSVGSYLIFEVWMKLRLPKGFFGI